MMFWNIKKFRREEPKGSSLLNCARRCKIVLMLCMFAIAVLLFAVEGISAYAASSQEAQDAGIQNRYKLLQDLEGKGTRSQGAITETRTSVLVSVNRALDGCIVSFEGEAIGGIIRENANYCWVNMLGTDGSMVGVEMTYDEASQIKDFGSYQKKGTTLRIEGLYSIACKEHQGELDVHATSVSVVSEGSKLIHSINLNYLPFIGIGFATTFVLIFVFVLMRKAKGPKKKRKHKHNKAKHKGEKNHNKSRKGAHSI